MRKLMTIAILLMYALSSSGTSLYLHFCCGFPHVLAINDQPNAHDPCSMCDESGHHADAACAEDVCELGVIHQGCQDVYVDTIDVTTDHIIHGDKNSQQVAQPVEIMLPWTSDVAAFVTERRITSFADSSPPATSAVPLFIYHCTYRI